MKQLVGYDWPEGSTKQVAYVSQDRHIHEFFVGVGGEWQHADITMLAGAPLADIRFIVGYACPEGRTKQITYIGQDGHVHELCVSLGGAWQHTDLTVITGAPPALYVTAGYNWSAGRSKQIVFIGDDSHLHELHVSMGGHWQHVDLTALTNAPLPGSNFMVGYQWSEGRSKQVAYVGREGHIHELFVEVGGAWRHSDLSMLTNAPRAVDITVGYEWHEGHCKQVSFVSEDGHIHELCQVAGSKWTHADLHTLVNAPSAMNVLTGYAWPQGHSKQIAYLAQDGHIHELHVEAGNSWKHGDLTQYANAPVTPITCMTGYAWNAGDSKQVTYVGIDGIVRELYMPQHHSWGHIDLNARHMAIPVRF